MGGSAAPPRTAPGFAAQDLAAQAVQADEERIALDLVDTVIRDLYLVGLRLASASQRDGEPQQPCVVEALEGIDQVIQSIRGVVFNLGGLSMARQKPRRGARAGVGRWWSRRRPSPAIGVGPT